MCHDNIYLTPYLYPESCRGTEGLQGNSHEQSGCAREVGTVLGGFWGKKRGLGSGESETESVRGSRAEGSSC